MDISQFEDRKKDHLRLALDPQMQSEGYDQFARVDLIHEALPEIQFSDIRLTTPLLESELSTPFYVAGMTAGHADAVALNERIALACERRGWAMGVGSQRRELTEGSAVDHWSSLRKRVPKLKLFGNLGLAQAIRSESSHLQKLVDSLNADALVIHLNAHQEAIQPEGTTDFRGGLKTLQRLIRDLSVPVIVKETGCGISAPTFSRLQEIGVSAVDVSGRGGTHWGRIEGARASEASATVHARAAETFKNWGIPTIDAVQNIATILSGATQLWASGGVRTGLDAAKVIALGAHRVGYAMPALRAAIEGENALDLWMQQQEFELKLALFCTGCETPAKLRDGKVKWKLKS